jgi:hypothetical protein
MIVFLIGLLCGQGSVAHQGLHLFRAGIGAHGLEIGLVYGHAMMACRAYGAVFWLLFMQNEI